MRKQNTSAKPITDEKLAELKANAMTVLCDVRKSLLVRFPFVGSIAMSLDLVPTRDDRNPTAATDGTAMYFDIAFLSELKPEERMFVFAHEIYHNVMMHSLRNESRDRSKFNIACDLEVNQLLEDDGLTAPKDGCFIRSSVHPNGYAFPRGKSAEEYYSMLLEDSNSNQSSKRNKNNGETSGSSTGDETTGNQDGKLEGQFDRHISKDEDLSEEPERDVSDKYGKVGRDPDFRPNVTESSVEHIREAAVTAAQMIERQGGSLPNHVKRIVNQMTEPKVDWRECLSQFITRSCGEGCNSWNRPNRRFAYNGTYLPSHESKNMNIAVILDTSGSVVETLPEFLGELNSLVKSFGNYKLTVIQNDADVQDVAEYTEAEPLDLENVKFEVRGFGGTDLAPAFKHVTENAVEADCIVAMTDGEFYNDIPAEICDIPTMWLLNKGGTDSHITFGEVIEYDGK